MLEHANIRAHVVSLLRMLNAQDSLHSNQQKDLAIFKYVNIDFSETF